MLIRLQRYLLMHRSAVRAQRHSHACPASRCKHGTRRVCASEKSVTVQSPGAEARWIPAFKLPAARHFRDLQQNLLFLLSFCSLFHFQGTNRTASLFRHPENEQKSKRRKRCQGWSMGEEGWLMGEEGLRFMTDAASVCLQARLVRRWQRRQRGLPAGFSPTFETHTPDASRPHLLKARPVVMIRKLSLHDKCNLVLESH